MMRRARLLAPLALAVLSAVAASSLGRVVDSSRFVLPVLGAALLPHALGAVVRWRGWSVWIGWAVAVVGLRHPPQSRHHVLARRQAGGGPFRENLRRLALRQVLRGVVVLLPGHHKQGTPPPGHPLLQRLAIRQHGFPREASEAMRYSA